MRQDVVVRENPRKTVTLFDESGNPVTVELRNGSYELATRDEAILGALGEILGQLRKIAWLLEQ